MKKFLSLLLTFVLALGVLQGCGSAEKASSNETTTGEAKGDVVYRTLDERKWYRKDWRL